MKKVERVSKRSSPAAEPEAGAMAANSATQLHRRIESWWRAADWGPLCSLDLQTLSSHPQRAQIAALRAAAWQQCGDRHSAHHDAEQALAWGYSRRQLASVLVASARHSLARAAWLAGRESHANSLFSQGLAPAIAASESERFVQVRVGQIARECDDARQAMQTLRRQGVAGATTTVPAWLNGLVDRCLAAPDLHEWVDHTLATELSLPDDRLLFLLGLADRMVAKGDKLSAIHFLQTARWSVDGASPAMQGQLVSRLTNLGATGFALDLAVQQVLSANAPGLTPATANALAQTYQRLRDNGARGAEHGHDLLLTYLQQHTSRLKTLAAGRRLVLIEIGTTREDVPGQGSTRKLAEYCQREGIAFVTVDMDPHNSRMARGLFARLGADFEAVTARGEDYLRDRTGPIDLVFLDAYDFDHGKHSDLRQSRYEKYLGGRIDEQQCHLMHLHCAQSLSAKLWTHGLVCIDDTWLEGARWTAKGTLAVPYLLDNGFTLVERRNRAALLERSAEIRS